MSTIEQWPMLSQRPQPRSPHRSRPVAVKPLPTCMYSSFSLKLFSFVTTHHSDDKAEEAYSDEEAEESEAASEAGDGQGAS